MSEVVYLTGEGGNVPAVYKIGKIQSSDMNKGIHLEIRHNF